MVQYVLYLIGLQFISRMRPVEADTDSRISIEELSPGARSPFLFIAESAKQCFQLLPSEILWSAPKALQEFLVLAHQAVNRIGSMSIVCYR